MDERRRYPRADLVFNVSFEKTEDQHLAAISENLSAGGVAIKTDSEFSIGDEIKVEFSIKDLPGKISSGGKVIRAWEEDGSWHAAIQFTRIEEKDLDIVNGFIAEYILKEMS